MAYSPVGFINPQYYVDYANWWLKGYQQATTTPLSMATDASGLTQIVRAEITSAGFIKTSGGALFTPHFNQAYDIWIFPSAAEADANDTTNAIQVADNLWLDNAVDNVTGERVRSFDILSDMVSAADLTVGDIVITNGHDTIGDGGENRYEIVAAGTGTDDGGSFIDLAVHQAKGLFPGQDIKIEQFGATTSLPDNSSKIQAAIDFATSSNFEIVTSAFIGRFPCQTVIELKDNVTLKDIRLTADLTGNPDYFIRAQGVIGTSTLTTANVDAGSVTVNVTSSAGFTIGQYIVLKDPTRLGGRWPYTVSKIENIAANVITLEQPTGVEYLLANSCTAEPITAVVNASLDNVDVLYSATGTSKFVFQHKYTAECIVKNCSISEHAYTSNPTAAVSIRADECNSYEVNNCNIAQNLNTDGGNAVLIFGMTDSKVVNVTSSSTNFGIGLWRSYGAYVSGCQVSGKAASGDRGIKMAGCQQSRIENNTVNNFDSGLKVEDSGMFILDSNTLSNNGLGGSFAINISHQNASSSADIRPSVVSDNQIFNTDGTCIFLDANTFQTTVTGNVTRQSTGEGILCLAPDCIISNNFIYDWQLGAGIRFVGRDIVMGNVVLSLNASLDAFKLHTIPSDTDYTVFTGNASQANAIVTDKVFFEKVAVMHGNAIKDLGNRIMFAPAAPVGGTFTRGDKVYDNTPSAAGKIGFVCTGSGTPGVWKPFGAIDA